MIRIGTRKSALAIIQAEWVKAQLEQRGVECTLIKISSRGDSDRSTTLYEFELERPGIFTKELEDALLNKEIDLAVHSLKDLPTVQPPGLEIVAIPKRGPAGDMLVSSIPASTKMKIGTSSLRREALLVAEGYEQITPIRGNVPTRIEKVRAGEVDGVVLAEAGLSRLNLDLKDFKVLKFPVERFVPAPGQGALALEVRADAPAPLRSLFSSLNDPDTSRAVKIERNVLSRLHGGCTLPLGVYCNRSGTNIKVCAFLGVYKEESGIRQWESFKRFDFVHGDDVTLVARTVEGLQSYS